MPDRIAILGWGSLLWDEQLTFDQQHDVWQFDGPLLKIEFSRISTSRAGALTLVLDSRNGTATQVAYCASRRSALLEAVEDLRERESTKNVSNIAYTHRNGEERSRDGETGAVVSAWAIAQGFDAVVWTDLQSNFRQKTGRSFSVDAAVAYLQHLPKDGRRAAFEYINKAPAFVDTPLRRRVVGAHG
ncbi:hypothetical protein [Enhydrobacter aerosaccus]|uniref:hypothetical protein n=1 Tax=Enhydrobacter aerosaccus TaxID=225324 RepID=UPI000A2F3F13|nr:hypothetical protein [Enhydrobacter aerosaccus]